MQRYGCIGKTLKHSFSKEIHAKLADYEYELIELTEDALAPFLAQKDFAAINVTIPYKQSVIPYLDAISTVAERIGAVNTIVNKDGKLYGYNTDYHGMKALIERAGIEVSRKKVLVLGTGGTAKTAQVVATDLGAAEIIIVSRTKKETAITYEDAIRNHFDANVIINTTPSGMYPDSDVQPIDLSAFSQLEGVIDVIYNPLCTNLVLDAKQRGIKAEGGLYMLVMQAVVAAEQFLDKSIPRELANQVYTEIVSAKENIVLIGMPGSGKTTVGQQLPLQEQLQDFVLMDTDKEIEKRCGCTIKELIAAKGETYFRDLETEVIKEVSAVGGRIIATGGGAVLRAENVQSLKRNGKVYFLNAALNRLQATDDRPLSDTKEKLEQLYMARKDIYRASADVIVPDLLSAKEEAEFIIENRKGLMQ